MANLWRTRSSFLETDPSRDLVEELNRGTEKGRICELRVNGNDTVLRR